MYRLPHELLRLRILNSKSPNQISNLSNCKLINPNILTNLSPFLRFRSFTTKEYLIDDNNDNCSNNRTLPKEFADKLVTLKCKSAADGGVCEVLLVGTCHVSQKSCDFAQAVISFLKPQVVFLELCAQRKDALKLREMKVPTVREMVKMWIKKDHFLGILFSWYIAKVASQLKVIPGNEFRVAYEEATKYGGKVILGDRPVEITLKRLWEKLPLFKVVSSLLFQSDSLPSHDSLTEKVIIDGDVDVDAITILTQQLSKQFPTIAEVLVHERDKYMSSKLLKVASQHNSVVAVVGMGHLPGIEMNWKQSIQARELLDTSMQNPDDPVAKITP